MCCFKGVKISFSSWASRKSACDALSRDSEQLVPIGRAAHDYLSVLWSKECSCWLGQNVGVRDQLK